MITIEVCQSREEAEKVVAGINNYNDSQTDRILPEVWTPIDLIAKNPEGVIVGGILGGIGYYAGYMIKVLWVAEKERKSGLGAKLLEQAEALAKEKGAKIAILDTFSFQAETFYLKNGYQRFGKIEDYPKKGQSFIFLKKEL
ncbi:GNAT family N-acetyltransferase [Tenacibaculum sp. 190524A02b]|uniref:Predicted N-acetyltransferase YhbS n=1 Tax=Tenacibaculum vairaonense TaxID=3137860 RepID=A0ABP1FD80_9FLAO